MGQAKYEKKKTCVAVNSKPNASVVQGRGVRERIQYIT